MSGTRATRIVRRAAVTAAVGLLLACTQENPAYNPGDALPGQSHDTGPGPADSIPVPDGAVDAPPAPTDAPAAPDTLSVSDAQPEPEVSAGPDVPVSSDASGPDVPSVPDVPLQPDGPSPTDSAPAVEAGKPDAVLPPDGSVICATLGVGSGTGLRAEYFDNSDFTGKRVTRTDPTIDWSFGLNSPDPSLDPNDFSARWTGQLEPLYSGPHTFTASYDDGMRMFIDERVVIYRWGPRIVTGQDSATVTLQAGRKYDLRVEFFDQGSAATAKLAWQNPCQPNRQAIPQWQLYPVSPAAPVCLAERAPGSGTGLKVDYFALDAQTKSLATATHARLDFDWGTGAPASGVPADFFARWTGSIEAPVDGPLTLYLSTDDVGRLRLGGVQLLDSFSEPFGPQEVAVTVDVKAGQRYDLGIDLRDDTGAAFVHLSWSWPCQPKVIIPTHRLYLP